MLMVSCHAALIVALAPFRAARRNDLAAFCSGNSEDMTSQPLPRGPWRPSTEVLERQALWREEGDGAPQLAKDEAYASAVMKAWREDLDERGSRSVCSPLTYACEADGSSLYGHICRPADSSSREKCLPGVVLFHTGAGPQDIFLRWKADALANDRGTFDGGCVVLIADLLGDAGGWAWRDRERYERVRASLLAPPDDERGERAQLRGRVRAALAALSAQPGVDPRRLGALGFCLGGHPVLELARMRDPAVRALVTFHGVFDGAARPAPVEAGADVFDCDVLVCTGADDPFVPAADLAAALAAFRGLGYRTRALELAGARHGFTNPAQDANPSAAFAYSAEAQSEAWAATLSLLKDL